VLEAVAAFARKNVCNLEQMPSQNITQSTSIKYTSLWLFKEIAVARTEH